MKTSAAIRSQFLDYFAGHGHTIVPSAPLVPANDPTLLFTNAGMVQFKDVFLGAEQRNYTRAASSQRCLRAGGKHNDLDQVGYTTRHHTFFEMLGNFSFGDYFKEEAIERAWELLTGPYGLPAERLFVTIYEEDDEAMEIWRGRIGVDGSRIARIGAHDNFWSMGDTGPCGPCTEIFYDHGPEIPGGPPGSADGESDRFIEVWNLVFMQYDRLADGTLKPLPKPCVDTGMGLERLAAILQGVHDNYETDLFRPLMREAARQTGCRESLHPSLKVLADHIRACAFLIADGVLPANEGRGYVLRRIIRRAIRHGHQLGATGVFFWRLYQPLSELMAPAYPELQQAGERICNHLREEEERFRETLERGMELLQRALDEQRAGQQIPGELAFKLYDTYGFPLDLTRDVAREHGLGVDEDGFERHMRQQRERARAASRFQQQAGIDAELVSNLAPTRFTGYERLRENGCRVLALIVDGQAVERLQPGEQALVILDRTPFYAESGGQVGDTGKLLANGASFRVTDTRKHAGSYHLHYGELTGGSLAAGAQVTASVDAGRRQAIVRHHSATHLLNAALRRVLGDHVEQQGSLVAPDRLRFDFTHPRPVSVEELDRIETLVNDQIQANQPVEIRHMPLQQALDSGALALFDEKYGDDVRVLRFGDFSMELCGGTHVRRVGDIGLFKIVSETGIAAGIRRIEAVAGRHAVAWIQQLHRQTRELSELLKSTPGELVERARQMQQRTRKLQTKVRELQGALAGGQGADLLERAETLDGVKLVVADVGAIDPQVMREQVDRLKAREPGVVVLLASQANGKVRLAAGVGDALTGRLHAGELVNYVAGQVGGKGGGRADFAQAGGSHPERLVEALRSVPDWVRQNSAKQQDEA